MSSHLVKYAKGLIGQYYQTEGNTKLVIRLAGAPGMPSSSEAEALFLSKAGFDLIRPDYYGHGRSDGFFSAKNCIQTAYDTIQTFRQGMPLFSIYENSEVLTPVYDEIVVVGGSYGGWIAAMMPKFDEQIKEVVLLYPALGEDNMNLIGYPEESDEEFLRQYVLAYKHLYRFAEGVDPYEAMLDIGTLSPLQDLNHLQNTNIFIAHGTADEIIWSGRSAAFVEKLFILNPEGNYKYAEYYGLGHGGTCKEAGLKGWLQWRKNFIS